MLKNHLINIYNKAEGQKNEYGVWIEGELEFTKQKYVDIQPYSTELLLKDYGYNIEVTKRIFDDTDENIVIGTILEHKSDKYEVRKIIPWDTYVEVMCFGL